ncbi:MAG TPA: CHAT domain-containing protein [Thermoanaerobaculia bacterium]|nr:CHAT domain-containing protein [Thermoanaerobaculia bacterium]
MYPRLVLSAALLVLAPHTLVAAERLDTGDLPEAGVVVEKVTPASTGATAGLEPGDVIRSWSCAASPPAFPQPASGAVRSPYDLLPLEIEESPRRAVALRGKRGEEERVWTLTASAWGVEARPGLPSDLAALYRDGKASVEAGDLAAAERSWRSAAQSARTAGDGRLAGWLLERLARTLAKAGKWPEADAAYQEALADLERESEHPAAAELLRVWGDSFQVRGAWDAALERYRKALELDRMTAPKSLAAARSLGSQGIIAAKRGDHDAAEDLLKQALAIREELAPGTTAVAEGLLYLGMLARRSGDLAASEEYLVRGEQILRRLAPDSLDHGRFLQSLGNLAWDRGDLESAESLFRQAIATYEKTLPEGLHVVGCLTNLANVAVQRGDLATADNLLLHVLALQERTARDELDRSSILTSLGNIAVNRGDLESAGAYFRRALAILEKLAPGGAEIADSLSSLGRMASLQGDFATARTSLRRALELQEKLAPGSIRIANILEHLADVEADHGGGLATAEGLLRQALATVEKAAPESLTSSVVLRDLGEIVARRGRLQEALALERRAVKLQRKLFPEGNNGEEARTLYSLGRVERRMGRSQEGISDLCHAVDILDRQWARLGGTPEAKTSFVAVFADTYQACLEGLIKLGRPVEAFHVLEKGRARSFLELLAERDLRLSDLPPELAAERRRVNAEYDRVQSEFAPLSAGRDDAAIGRLTGELRDLRSRQEEILARIRQESPRAAALHDPAPLDLAGARAALDPGTVLLEYAVGAERSWLFVVQSANVKGSGLSVFPIALGATSLRDQVESFRLVLKNPGSEPVELQALARRLYDLLVRPAEAQIAGAQRILFSPHGPLDTLPFAALVRGGHYLVEWKPIHSVLSATVYAELAKSRPPRRAHGEERLVAFGDPVYRPLTPDAAADPEVREAVRRGLTLRPLPSSGDEVKSIATLYPQAEIYLGRDATEERAKSIGREARLVHFACHGVLDEQFPLNSALVFTQPEKLAEGKDNGLLQAWEIFQSVRLDADLVTLSACDTGLGRETAGEGLVGLTRAFQYAGARSVLASLWGVADRSTAGFMKSFYGYLHSGMSKDEALRAAQIDHIREKAGPSHPFHWAAFQLTGDWQ